jgi:hypothetical protein
LNRTAISLDFRRPSADKSFALKRFIPRLMLGHRFGCFPAPSGTRPAYDSKATDPRQPVWEIRVSSILTPDRTEQSAPEDQDQDDETHEDTTA